MAAFLNTEDYGYTCAGAIPVVQQIVGLTALLKNLIGLVKDVAQAVFTCSSFTEIKTRDSASKVTIVNRIEEFKKLQETTEINRKALLNSNVKVEDDEIKEAIAHIEKQQADLNLRSLASEAQDIINRSAYNNKTLMGQYDVLAKTMQLQLKEAMIDLEGDDAVLDFIMCQTGLERLHNIAIAILTIIPVVGTIYNGISLQYFPAEATAKTR